jgi:erythrocyte band 7 integral membrane protein
MLFPLYSSINLTNSTKAADILSSAPAMQIRYLEAMQAMAKTANSKIIFMPGPSDSGHVVAKAIEDDGHSVNLSGSAYAQQSGAIQQTVNARVLEDI